MRYRWTLRFLTLGLATCVIGAVGVGRKSGSNRKAHPGVSGFENPLAADLVFIYGQSSSTGFCDGGAAPPSLYLCDQPRSTPVLPNPDPGSGYFMACYDSVNDDYSEPLTALDLTNTSCRRWQYQQPMLTQAEYWRVRTERSPATITCPSPGQPGISIVGLSDPSTHWTRLVSCVTETFNRVTASPATYGAAGTPAMVVRHMHMVQGESDDGTVSRNNNYTAEVLDFVDDFQTMVKGITGQTSDVVITWDNPSNWQENDTLRCPTCTQLRDAAAQRSFLHVIGSKGHATPTYPDGLAGTTAISFEFNGASALHWSPSWHILEGFHAAKHAYCALFGGCPVGAPQIESAAWNGSQVVVTYDRELTRDSVFCPDHWNGDLGFELINVAGPLWDDTEYVGSPQITAVAVSGQEVTLTTDVQPQDFTRIEVGNRAEVRSAARCVLNGRVTGVLCPIGNECGAGETCLAANEPENGCRDYNNTLGAGANAINTGAPFVQIYAADTTEYPIAAMEAHDWAIMESFGPITGAIAAPTNTSPSYVRFNATDEHITFPDESPDAFSGATSLTVSLWIDTNGETVDRRLMRKFSTFRVLFDHSAGVGSRLIFNVGAIGNTSNPVAFELATDTSDFVHYMMVFDASQPAGSQNRHIIACEDVVDAEQGTFPATLADSAEVLTLGSSFNLSPQVQIRDVAIWAGFVPTDAQVLQICRGQTDLTAVTPSLPEPDYYVRFECGDSLTTANGVNNLGCPRASCAGTEGDGTGVNMEADDLVNDRPSLCP